MNHRDLTVTTVARKARDHTHQDEVTIEEATSHVATTVEAKIVAFRLSTSAVRHPAISVRSVCRPKVLPQAVTAGKT
jgi:hypothetical protein